MAKKEPATCPMSFMFMLFFFINIPASHGQELELLLSFKSSINNQFHFLANWNSSSSFCKWYGIICDNSSHVKTIQLSRINISGRISSIFELPYIETIDISSNQLSGQLYDHMFTSSSSSLRNLNISNNNFTGPIPRGSPGRLEILDLSNNMLTGKIPQEIGLFSSLKFLDLGGNSLVGRIPISIANITTLQFLTLASNQLVGEIPHELGQLRSLKWIYLGYNNLTGVIPKEIGNLTSLNHLDIVYNNLTGQIPSSLGNLSDLQCLFLYQNRLTGSIPKPIFGLKKLVSLDLSDNLLSGEIPELVIQLQNLEILHLFSNSFTGKIPNALTSLPGLQVLQLWSNKLTGKIPPYLGKKNNLTILDLSTNNLTGNIPESLCDSGRLFKLILFSNSLQGGIPTRLSSCKSLQRVRLQNNHFSGELSKEFTQLPLVYFLDISSNNLSGKVGEQKWDMPSLEMLNLAGNGFFGELPGTFGSDKLENLDLSKNRFSGAIPREFGSLTEIMQLKLSENKLSGEIPEELFSCKKLVSLDLSHNQLHGQIPAIFSEMPVLGQLDLSSNQLSGEVPRNLGLMQSLVQVNISHNHFHGNLPFTGAFLSINASAVAGNNLCGGDHNSTSGLPPCNKLRSTPVWRFFVVCVLGVLVVLAFAAFTLAFVCGRSNLELKRVENDDGMWEFQFFHSNISKSMTIDDILSSINEENVMSRGKRGVLYLGKSSIVKDMKFVVKEMNHVDSIPSTFWSEITEVGKLRHPNIVKLIGSCRSKKGAYVVYEYIEGSNLSEILRNLSWHRRQKIAMGIAKAQRFLHSSCSPRILVGDMSTERVIVNGKDEPRLRLSLPGFDTKSFNISSGYAVPEATESKEITEKSDIYGFGLILIELLTGRSPSDAVFGVHHSIVEWARYCYSDCHLDMWVDPIIRGHVANNQNQIVETMNLSLQCTAGDPTARPCASDVCKTLESSLRL
ncbi:Pkinase domain-containing protein/LRR_1 domain-containing protein/LRRNT_2 domain-containing protein/LRR_7 domain-containing protein/LRR_6 domain-containing protein/LRR_8 domain-containing protein [Cephalotus follicularis]|uniref:non-specific serine/threonine protein kinase n=1 Tax=Cephalotus follicularis TaxID=3775 RepID=A0A1Q3BC33_CEPFO|nr:Pkinase domain-containing protein/LRR_1 domain-containing protein/LRRNT_2 domain-containing protein/LRR_7 domain-containing protein/LRR_6 domain-containing protein/LRR_8 domain-containing protein [Cephalotus follicularis]